jgi:hypothetical protein
VSTFPDHALGWIFNIRRARASILERRRPVHLVLEIGRLLDEAGCDVCVRGRSGELQKRRRLTREILSAGQYLFPHLEDPQIDHAGTCISFRKKYTKVY